MRWMSVAWGIAVLAVVVHASTNAWNATYSIDPNAIATGATADVSVFQDLGPCTCDMTYSLCDVGCKCDSDCSTDEQTLFSSVLPDSSAKLNIKRCVDAASVDVNARSQLVYSFVDNMVCVQDSNNPIQGVYYLAPPNDVSATMFNAYRLMKPFAFESLSSSSSIPSSLYYQTGSPIVAALTSGSGGLMPYRSGFLPMPKSSLSASCDDYNFALFQQSSTTTCTRYVSDISLSCTLELDASLVSSKLHIGKTATATADIATNYVSVTVGSVLFEDRVTGARTFLPSLPASTYDATTCTCKNAFKQVSYSLSYDKSGQIVSAAADVIVSDAVTLKTCSISPASSIDQTYSVNFLRSWDSTDTGRGKSGNPGYLMGYPVLAGQLVTVSGKQAIQQYVNGLTVLGPSSACSTAGHVSIGFNESLQSSCLISLSATELQSACQSGQLSQYLTISSPVYIGQWGSSSYTDVSTWIKLDQETPPASFTWSSATRSCSGVVNSINFEFVTASLGSVSNPQSKILAARLRYGTTTWRMKTITDTQQQNFELKATATFITIPDGGSTTVTPPAPPLFPRLPADVLYPLVM